MADEIKVKKNQKKNYIHAVGRRRSAVARIRLYTSTKEKVVWVDQEIGKGQIFVNEKPISEYFSGEASKARYEEPLRLTDYLDKVIITAKVAGGGRNGQLDAFVHGVSRALSEFDREKLRPILKKKGLLTRDARTRERRKVGTGGKARHKKQSPKR